MIFILRGVADSRLAVLCSFAVSLILIYGAGTTAYADNYGIVLDNTCLTFLKNNITTDCPTYEDIITLFPDTSNRKITGEFGYNHGIYQRLPTKLINSFGYYQYRDSNILFVDPPSEYRGKINVIEIKANLQEYLLPKHGTYNAANHSLTMGYGRYVDSCRTAYIDSGQWSYLLGDSINYLDKNCAEDATTFVSKVTTQLTKVKHDITTSYKWKLAEWQKESLLKCGTKVCLYVRNQSGPP
jgi:hypothetical protein